LRLAAEREAVYSAIRDLDDDFDTGKLTPEDHAALRGGLVARAVQLLEAEREAADERRPRPGPSEALSVAPRAARACASCGAEPPQAARFCPQCGAKLAGDAG
jgi:hypothetical protein